MAVRIAAARLRLPDRSPATAWLTGRCAGRRIGVGLALGWALRVSTALGLSDRHLTADQQRALRWLACTPAADRTLRAGSLADATVRDAARLLDQLYAAEPARPTRFTAATPCMTWSPPTPPPWPPTYPNPTGRPPCIGCTTTTPVTGTQAIEPRLPRGRPTNDPAHRRPTPRPTLTGEREAQAWLDSETDNLLAAAHHAATGHRADHTLHQSATLRRRLRTRGHYSRAALLHQQALTSARHTANQAAEQDALSGLGYVHRIQGRNGPAAKCFERALAGARRTGNRTAEQDALTGLGYVHYVQGRYGPP